MLITEDRVHGEDTRTKPHLTQTSRNISLLGDKGRGTDEVVPVSCRQETYLSSCHSRRYNVSYNVS